MSMKPEARAQALVQYTHAKVRDRYDADLLMAGFEDGAKWQASRTDALEAAIERVLNLIGDIGPEARRILTAVVGGGDHE